MLCMCSTPECHPSPCFVKNAIFMLLSWGLSFESYSDLFFSGNLELKTLGTFFFFLIGELPQGSYREQN